MTIPLETLPFISYQILSWTVIIIINPLWMKLQPLYLKMILMLCNPEILLFASEWVKLSISVACMLHMLPSIMFYSFLMEHLGGLLLFVSVCLEQTMIERNI
jgi:hypothetical protein